MTGLRVPALDGWRGISILLVLAAHAGVGPAVPGGLGVTIFFFVSGLLITGQLLDEHRVHGRIDLGRFYWRRALRLLPASTAFIVIAGIAYAACGGSMRAWAPAAALLYAANYAELASHVFDTTLPGLAHPYVILWSLAIEEHFYVFWPVLLLILSRGGSRARIVALLVCIAGCLAWRCHLAPICGAHGHACGPHGDDWIGKATDTRADSLAFGALAASVLRSRLAAMLAPLVRSPIAVASAALLLVVTVVIRDHGFRETWRYTLQGLALLVLVPASMAPGRLTALLSRPALVLVGRLSYGLYLWHWLALMLASRLAPGGVAFGAAFAALTLAFTLASWFAIERPVIALRRRAGSHAQPMLLPRTATWRALPEGRAVAG